MHYLQKTRPGHYFLLHVLKNSSVFMHNKNVGFSVFYTACTCVLNYNKMMPKTPTIHFDMHACIWYCGCLSKYTQ